MNEEYTFEQNLLRLIAAQLHFLSGMQAAQDMFGKSYFSLGNGERLAVDQAVFGMIASNYQATTRSLLATQNQQQGPVGFASSPTQAEKAAPQKG